MKRLIVREPRKLSPAELRDIRSLVKTMCANYNKTYNCCALLDDYGCYMLSKQLADRKLCKYFENAVLPLNSELERVLVYCALRNTKPCAVCSRKFTLKGRQIYCSPKCKKKGMRIKERDKKRKQRLDKG